MLKLIQMVLREIAVKHVHSPYRNFSNRARDNYRKNRPLPRLKFTLYFKQSPTSQIFLGRVDDRLYALILELRCCHYFFFRSQVSYVLTRYWSRCNILCLASTSSSNEIPGIAEFRGTYWPVVSGVSDISSKIVLRFPFLTEISELSWKARDLNSRSKYDSPVEQTRQSWLLLIPRF